MFSLLLLGVFLVWYISDRIYTRYWYQGLTVDIHFQEKFIYEGESSAMKEILVNDKLLPLPAVEVRFSCSRNIDFLDEASANVSSTDRSYKRDVFSLLFHQRIERLLPFIANKRGVYQIYEASITGYDFFFRSDYYIEFTQETTLYVYPRQVDTYRIVMLYQAITGEILAHRLLYPDPFEFSGIREYRKEDPVNHINWKASARTGELMVNQFASTTSIDITVLFDVEDQLILKHEDLVEETICIVSSLAKRLLINGLSFHVVGNSFDQFSNSLFDMDVRSMEDIFGLDQKLAYIDSTQIVCSMAELLQKEADKRRTEHTYILLSKNRESVMKASLASLIGTDNQVVWVIPIRVGDVPHLMPYGIPHVKVIQWEI